MGYKFVNQTNELLLENMNSSMFPSFFGIYLRNLSDGKIKALESNDFDMFMFLMNRMLPIIERKVVSDYTLPEIRMLNPTTSRNAYALLSPGMCFLDVINDKSWIREGHIRIAEDWSKKLFSALSDAWVPPGKDNIRLTHIVLMKNDLEVEEDRVRDGLMPYILKNSIQSNAKQKTSISL
jgi:hypothetical protein